MQTLADQPQSGKDHTKEPFSVLLIGATGATGREVVKTLLELPALEKMTLLGRRVDTEVIPQDDRVHQVVVNFDKLGFEFQEKKIPGHTFCMSFLGTTKSAAGSTEAYHKVKKEQRFRLSGLACLENVSHYLFWRI